MAHFKVPRTVVFGPLPKTSTGKIQKFVLRDQAKALAWIRRTVAASRRRMRGRALHHTGNARPSDSDSGLSTLAPNNCMTTGLSTLRDGRSRAKPPGPGS